MSKIGRKSQQEVQPVCRLHERLAYTLVEACARAPRSSFAQSVLRIVPIVGQIKRDTGVYLLHRVVPLNARPRSVDSVAEHFARRF